MDGIRRIDNKGELAELFGLLDGFWRRHLSYVRQFPDVRNFIDASAHAMFSLDQAKSLEAEMERIEEALRSAPNVDDAVKSVIDQNRAATREAEADVRWGGGTVTKEEREERTRESWFGRIGFIAAAVITVAGLMGRGALEKIGGEAWALIWPEIAPYVERIIDFVTRALFK